MKSYAEIFEEAYNLGQWFPNNPMVSEARDILLDIAGTDDADMMTEAAAIDYLHALEGEKPAGVELARDFLFPIAPPKTFNEILDSIDQLLEELADEHPGVREALHRSQALIAQLDATKIAPTALPGYMIYRDGNHLWEHGPSDTQ